MGKKTPIKKEWIIHYFYDVTKLIFENVVQLRKRSRMREREREKKTNYASILISLF